MARLISFLQELFIRKLGPPVIGAFVAAWVVLNWDHLILLFWGNGLLEERVEAFRLAIDQVWYKKYAIPFNSVALGSRSRPPVGVLPQGAATSPMLSNLAAKQMDQAFATLSDELGAVYTRYADDITLSLAEQLPDGVTTGAIYRRVQQIIKGHGFQSNKNKTRVAGPGSKKVVLGLLVDGRSPRLSKQMYRRIERLLYACNKFGLEATAAHEGFDSALGFYNHLAGLIAFTKDVDVERWGGFDSVFRRLINVSEFAVG